MSEEWRNWSGLESARPDRVTEPADVAAVVAEVERARSEGTSVKMIGTGHSFTAIAAPEHTMLRPQRLTGIVTVDREAMTVTALAGTRLKDFNTALEDLGLSLHNMGDIAEQTLAGAISTGTHGTGGVAAGLAAQVVGLELVTGTGEVLRASADENPDVLEFARVGLGALGVITTITFAVEPLFLLEAVEQPMSWDEALSSFDEMTADPPPRRHVLVPPHRPDAHQAQQPARRRALRGAAAVVVPGLARRRPPVQPALRRWRPRRSTGSPGPSRAPTSSTPGCSARAPTATSPTASSPPSATWSSARWSTPCPARPGSRC